MSRNISFFKKIKLFNSFKKILIENESELESRFNIRIDKAYRIYTVINIPEDLVGEAYSLKKSDIDRISENYIKQYTAGLGKFLDSKGLSELHDFYNMNKVGKYSYLLVFGFKFFRSNRFYNNLYWRVIPVSILIIIILFFFFK
jgi:hypothetical protein